MDSVHILHSLNTYKLKEEVIDWLKTKGVRCFDIYAKSLTEFRYGIKYLEFRHPFNYFYLVVMNEFFRFIKEKTGDGIEKWAFGFHSLYVDMERNEYVLKFYLVKKVELGIYENTKKRNI